MLRLIPLVCCLGLACSGRSGPPRWRETLFSIDPAFMPYIDSWNANFPKTQADSRLVVRWAREEDNLGGAAGLCAISGWSRTIMIRYDYWLARPKAREPLIWHELGHCVGAIECHRNEMSWGVADHLMHESISFVHPKWGDLREYYIEDMQAALADPEGFCSSPLAGR